MLASFLLYILRKVTLILIIALIFVSMINVSENIKKIEENKKSIAELENFAQTFENLVRVDSVRNSALEKIVGIMSIHNRQLSAKDKYMIANEIYNMSIKYENLDVDLICATITHESGRTWSPTVISPAGARGLMQIMPHTGFFLSQHEGIEWTSAVEILNNPIYNIRMGCRYLSMLIDLYHIDGGLAAYNGGERRAARWLASGRNDEVLLEETRGYVPAVLGIYDTYKN